MAPRDSAVAAAPEAGAVAGAMGLGTEAPAATHGIIAHVPNEGAHFVPVSAGTFPCGLAKVIVKVREVLCKALFGGEDSEEEEEEPDFRVLFRERDLEDGPVAAAFLKAMGAGHPCVVRVLFRLLGGKGGFGSLLRGQKGRGKKTTNLDAMRDLSGRRLRHSKAVERIKEWMAVQKRDDELVSALTGEGPELPKPTPKVESLDPEYVRRLKRGAALRPMLVSQGMRRLNGGTSSATSVQEPEEEATKRSRCGGEAGIREWFGAWDTLDGLSSPEEEQKEPEALPLQGVEDLKLGSILRVVRDSAFVIAAGERAGLSEEVWRDAWTASAGKTARVIQIDSENSQVKCRVPGVSDVWFPAAVLLLTQDAGEAWDDNTPIENLPVGKQESASTEDAVRSTATNSAPASSAAASSSMPDNTVASTSSMDTKAVACRAAFSGEARNCRVNISGASTGATELECADAKLVQAEDLKSYASAEELTAKVPPEVLKRSLQKLGLKCGGKPQERAARLFLLKHTQLAELPKTAFAAPPK